MLDALQAKWAVNKSIYNSYKKWEFIIVKNLFN